MRTPSLLMLLVLVLPVPLPSQEIMSYTEYQSLRHDEPYILELCVPDGPGALLYFGSRHSNDPEDPQVQEIREAFGEFAPDVVLTEGGDLDMSGLTRGEAVRRFGEFGLARWLAIGRGVVVEDLDPDRADEIAYLRQEGFTVPQLKVFYTLRQVAQSNRNQAEVDFDRAVPQYLQHLSARRGLPGVPETLSELTEEIRRLLPDLQNWREAPSRLFYPGPQTPHYFTNEIQTASNDFRDRYQLRRVEDLVRSGRRVFAIVGSTHVVMQEPALRRRLSAMPCT